jgi:hypothetical protein
MKPISESKRPVAGPNEATALLGTLFREVAAWRERILSKDETRAIVDAVVLLVEWDAINFNAPALIKLQQEATHGKDA